MRAFDLTRLGLLSRLLALAAAGTAPLIPNPLRGEQIGSAPSAAAARSGPTAQGGEAPGPASEGGAHAQHNMSRASNGVTSLDIVADGDRLQLLIGRSRDGRATLWHQVSRDGGKSWSKEVEVQGQPGTSPSVHRGSDARIAAWHKTLVAVWTTRDDANRHGAGPMAAARSTDGGKTWAPAEGPADWTKGPHAFLTLASDGKTWHAAWLDSRDGPPPVKGAQALRYAFSTNGGASWSKNVTLDDVTCACCWSVGQVNDRGDFFVLYRDKKPSDMSIGVVNHATGQWTRLATVGAFDWDFPGCPHIGGGLAIHSHGKERLIHAVVGTRKAESAGLYYLKSSDAGRSWMAPVRLGDASATHGDLTVAKGGRVAAVFDMIDPEINDGTQAIYATFSQDDGARWSEARRLSSPGKTASHPRVVSTRSGFVAFWTETGEEKETVLKMKALDSVKVGMSGRERLRAEP
ncbi:MAG: exo-alpha-sialidase [Alphaproteobacteria bacterium]|nr:exo-alpha-sialidase [Alphaproteobacteria bacterium]